MHSQTLTILRTNNLHLTSLEVLLDEASHVLFLFPRARQRRKHTDKDDMSYTFLFDDFTLLEDLLILDRNDLFPINYETSFSTIAYCCFVCTHFEALHR